MLSCSCRVQSASAGLPCTALQPRRQPSNPHTSTSSCRELVRAAALAAPTPAPNPGPGAINLLHISPVVNADAEEHTGSKAAPQADAPVLTMHGSEHPQLLRPTLPNAGSTGAVSTSTTPSHAKQALLARPIRTPPVNSTSVLTPANVAHEPNAASRAQQQCEQQAPTAGQSILHAVDATQLLQPTHTVWQGQDAQPQPQQQHQHQQPLLVRPARQPQHVPVSTVQESPQQQTSPTSQPSASHANSHVQLQGWQQISWQVSKYMADIREQAAVRQLPQALAEELLLVSESGPDLQRLTAALQRLSLPGHALVLAICAKWERPLQRAQLTDAVMQAWGQVLLPLVLQVSPHDLRLPGQSFSQVGSSTQGVSSASLDQGLGHSSTHSDIAVSIDSRTTNGATSTSAANCSVGQHQEHSRVIASSIVNSTPEEVMHTRDVGMLAAVVSITVSMGQLRMHCGLVPMAAIALYLQHHLRFLSSAQLVGVVTSFARMQYYPYTAPAERLAASINKSTPLAATAATSHFTQPWQQQTAPAAADERRSDSSAHTQLHAQHAQHVQQLHALHAQHAQQPQHAPRVSMGFKPIRRLRPAPCHWMESFLSLALQRLDNFTGPQVCQLLRSAAVLDMHDWSSSGSYAHVTRQLAEAVAARPAWSKDLVELIPNPNHRAARPAVASTLQPQAPQQLDNQSAVHTAQSLSPEYSGSSYTVPQPQGMQNAVEHTQQQGMQNTVEHTHMLQSAAVEICASIQQAVDATQMDEQAAKCLATPGSHTTTPTLTPATATATSAASPTTHPAEATSTDAATSGLKLDHSYNLQQVQVALWTLHHFSPRVLPSWMRVLVESAALYANDLTTLALHAVFQAMAEYKVQATHAAQERLWAAVQRRMSHFSINRLRQLLWWAQACGCQPPSHVLRAALHRAANLALLRMRNAGLPVSSASTQEQHGAGLPVTIIPSQIQQPNGSGINMAGTGTLYVSNQGSNCIQHSNQPALQFASHTVLLVRRRALTTASSDYIQGSAEPLSSLEATPIPTADYIKPVHVAQLLVLAARMRLRLPRNQAAPLAWLLASGLHQLTPQAATQGLAALAICAPAIAQTPAKKPVMRAAPAGHNQEAASSEEHAGGPQVVSFQGWLVASQAAAAALHSAYGQYVRVVLKQGRPSACVAALVSGLDLGIHPTPHTLRQLLWHAYHGGSTASLNSSSSRPLISARAAARLVCALATVSTLAVVLVAQEDGNSATSQAANSNACHSGHDGFEGSSAWKRLRPESSVRECYDEEKALIMELVPGMMLQVEAADPAMLQKDSHEPSAGLLIEYLWAVSKLGLLNRMEYGWWCKACSMLDMPDASLQQLPTRMLGRLIRLSTCRPPSARPVHLCGMSTPVTYQHARVSPAKQASVSVFAPEFVSAADLRSAEGDGEDSALQQDFASKAGRAPHTASLPDTAHLLTVMFQSMSGASERTLDAEQLTDLVWAAAESGYVLQPIQLQQLSAAAVANMAQLRLAHLPRLVLGLALCSSTLARRQIQSCTEPCQNTVVHLDLRAIRPAELLAAIVGVPVDALQRASSTRHAWGISYKLRQYLRVSHSQRNAVKHAVPAHNSFDNAAHAHNSFDNAADQPVSAQQHVCELVCACTPDQLAVLLLALARWELQLPADWLAAYLHIIQARGQHTVSFLGIQQCIESLVLLQHWPGKPFYNFLCKQLKDIRLRGHIADADDLHIRQLMHQLCHYGQLQIQWKEGPSMQPEMAAIVSAAELQLNMAPIKATKADGDATAAHTPAQAVSSSERVMRAQQPLPHRALDLGHSSGVQSFTRLLRRIYLQHLSAALSMLLASKAAVAGLLPAAAGATSTSRLASPLVSAAAISSQQPIVQQQPQQAGGQQARWWKETALQRRRRRQQQLLPPAQGHAPHAPGREVGHTVSVSGKQPTHRELVARLHAQLAHTLQSLAAAHDKRARTAENTSQ